MRMAVLQLLRAEAPAASHAAEQDDAGLLPLKLCRGIGQALVQALRKVDPFAKAIAVLDIVAPWYVEAVHRDAIGALAACAVPQEALGELLLEVVGEESLPNTRREPILLRIDLDFLLRLRHAPGRRLLHGAGLCLPFGLPFALRWCCSLAVWLVEAEAWRGCPQRLAAALTIQGLGIGRATSGRERRGCGGDAGAERCLEGQIGSPCP
mmetsp:Transcript_125011/g.324744  ORF Transcript_125011/g.324744 Transcript_125011/m.324744 type:complete len:209 (+) Transcript_125011:306-932(+)